MKKLIVLLALAAMSTGAFAQQWSFGPKAGVNFSNVSDLDGGDTKMMTGFYVGAFAEYRLNYWFGLQAEAVYSTQGTKFNTSPLKWELKQDYINVPILAKFYVLNSLSVDFGPQFGFKVSDKAKLKTGSTTTDFSTDTKGFDLSVGMGLTYTLVDRLDISARYNLGLTDTYGNIGGTNRNGVIQVGLGYRF